MLFGSKDLEREGWLRKQIQNRSTYIYYAITWLGRESLFSSQASLQHRKWAGYLTEARIDQSTVLNTHLRPRSKPIFPLLVTCIRWFIFLYQFLYLLLKNLVNEISQLALFLNKAERKILPFSNKISLRVGRKRYLTRGRQISFTIMNIDIQYFTTVY